MPVIGCPAFIWDGIFIGATASRDLRNASVLCALGFFTAWFAGIAVAGRGISNETAIHILMAAYFVHLAIRSIYLTATYKKQHIKWIPK
jgi:MATE family multidrug resistance protein